MTEKLVFPTSDIGGIDLEVQVFLGEDGTPVVQIDTTESGRFRINVNDAPVWDGNPETDRRPGANFEPLESLHPETGEPLELGANELLEFIQRLPADRRDIAVVVGGTGERHDWGRSVVRASIGADKSGRMLLLETDPPMGS